MGPEVSDAKSTALEVPSYDSTSLEIMGLFQTSIGPNAYRVE